MDSGQPVLTNVIIPVYNQGSDLEFTLSGLISNTPPFLYRLWIVDNGSAKETADFIDKVVEHYPSTNLIRSPKNLGFPAGNNLALSQIKEGHVCFLNSDTHCSPGWLEELLKVLESDPSIGLVGPITNGALLKYSQKVCDFSYPEISSADVYKVAKQFRLRAETMNRPYIVVDHPIMFFCTLVRDTCFKQVGLFDENFGLGCEEDNDYCIRAHILGWKMAVCYRSFVFHQRQKTYPNCFSSQQKAVAAYTDNHTYLKKKFTGVKVTPGFQRFIDRM